MKVTAVFVCSLLFSACGTLSEQQLEDRQYRKVDWENRYADYAGRCRYAGGRPVIHASSRLSRTGVPNQGDYYGCSRRIERLASN